MVRHVTHQWFARRRAKAQIRGDDWNDGGLRHYSGRFDLDGFVTDATRGARYWTGDHAGETL